MLRVWRGEAQDPSPLKVICVCRFVSHLIYTLVFILSLQAHTQTLPFLTNTMITVLLIKENWIYFKFDDCVVIIRLPAQF